MIFWLCYETWVHQCLIKQVKSFSLCSHTLNSVQIRQSGRPGNRGVTADPTAGKFQPNWEGPYVVTRPEEFESYAIDKTDGTPVPRMWNATHLKRYYQ